MSYINETLKKHYGEQTIEHNGYIIKFTPWVERGQNRNTFIAECTRGFRFRVVINLVCATVRITQEQILHDEYHLEESYTMELAPKRYDKLFPKLHIYREIPIEFLGAMNHSNPSGYEKHEQLEIQDILHSLKVENDMRTPQLDTWGSVSADRKVYVCFKYTGQLRFGKA